ncbi:MAG TPA: hypothetical protein PKI20_05890 [Verrucomicrobiota bacterium]|nr:hypothetical protein [Verrucomicrobiota bacterium]HQL77165.1 hypothetical protein [Verrucomicrobiota bacterium]
MKRTILLTAGLCLLSAFAYATITHTILTSYQTGSSSLTGNNSITADTERNTDVTVTNGTTTVTTWLSATNAQTLCLHATVNCSVLVCNGDTTNNTVTLTANSPNVSLGSNAVYSILNDVKATKLLILATNTGTFSLRALLDSTP